MLGRLEESETVFKECLSLSPDNILALKELVGLRKVTAQDDYIDRLLELKNKTHDAEDQTRLYFALGKAYYDLKEFDKSVFSSKLFSEKKIIN